MSEDPYKPPESILSYPQQQTIDSLELITLGTVSYSALYYAHATYQTVLPVALSFLERL